MNPSIETRLTSLAERFDEIERMLSDAGVIANQNQFRKLSQEYADITSVVRLYREYRDTSIQLEGARAMFKDSDPGMRDMAQEEAASAQARLDAIEQEIQVALLP